jgi:cytochrome P450 family 2 subfamily U polypeptide 1
MDTKGLVTANLYTVWIQCGLIGIVTLLVWPLIKQQVKKLPPGPIGLPFVGYWPFITSDPHEKFGELTKKYGPVFGVNILGKYYLVLNEFDAIKEAFVKQNDNFSGRPQEFSFFSWFFNFDSFVFHYGDEWKTQRRFAIKSLRDLGTGKWLEAKIQEYVADMMECVTETKGQPTDLYDYFLIPVLNVISGLVANKKYNVKDPEYWQLRDDIRGVFRTFPDAELQLCGPMMR